MIKTSVIIPSWNGKELLEKNLPQVLKTVPENCEVIVVENGSEDGSRKYLEQLKANSYQLKAIFNDRNLGFIGGCNQGVAKAKGKYVVLLNNDVWPEKNFLQPALDHFKNKNIFAVSFNEVNSDGGWSDILWYDGYFNYLPGKKTDQPHISGWASGGSAAFRKSMWEKLDGLDEMFAPFFWEDVDISYRGWKMGWKIIWEPKAKVIHKHESTISRLDKNFVDRIKERNQLLFIWKNITDSDLKFKHNLGLVQRVLTGPNYLKVIRSAKKRYKKFGSPKIEDYKRSDKEIFKLFDK